MHAVVVSFPSLGPELLAPETLPHCRAHNVTLNSLFSVSASRLDFGMRELETLFVLHSQILEPELQRVLLSSLGKQGPTPS